MKGRITFTDLAKVPSEANFLKLYEYILTTANQWTDLASLYLDFSKSNMKQYTFYKIINQFLNQSLVPLQIDLSQLEEITFCLQKTSIKSADFISAFSNCSKLKSISLDGDQVIAKNCLTFSKTFKPIEFLSCEGFFTKKVNYYYIQSDFLSEDLGIFEGIEEQVIQMNMTFSYQSLKPSLLSIRKMINLQDLTIEIVSLYNKEQIDGIDDILSCLYGVIHLQFLTVKISQADLVLPIEKLNFRNPVQLNLYFLGSMLEPPFNYILDLAKHYSKETQEFIIHPFVESINKRLFINVEKFELDGKSIENLIELVNLLSEGATEIVIQLYPHQRCCTQQWVRLINSIAKQKGISRVKIGGGYISDSIVALSLSKLMTCGIPEIQLFSQSLRNSELSIRLNQLSDYSLSTLFESVFHPFSVQLNRISIFAQIIIGKLHPISDYFSKFNSYLNYFEIKIEKSPYETCYLVQNAMDDRIRLSQKINELHIYQQKSVYYRLNEESLQLYIPNLNYGKFNQTDIVNNKLRKIFSSIQSLKINLLEDQSINGEMWKKVVQKFDLLCQFIEVQKYERIKKTMPMRMLVFYLLIGPTLPINPYMVFTDLYY